jgi:hypothetical protein
MRFARRAVVRTGLQTQVREDLLDDRRSRMDAMIFLTAAVRAVLRSSANTRLSRRAQLSRTGL